MEIQQIVQTLTPEIYQSMRTAIELGKWADGRKVTPEQRENTIELIIYYEHLHNIPESERVGHMEKQGKPTYGEIHAEAQAKKQQLFTEVKL